jgi:hypothetical protein
MDLGQNLQVLELFDGIICSPSSLVAFTASDTDTNVGLSDHENIIITIAHSYSDSMAFVFGENHNI